MKRRKSNKSLKIGFLSYYPPTYGGATRLATRLASKLREGGHETHFIGYDTDFNPQELEAKGIVLHKVDRIDLPATSSQPYTWTLASRLDDVHRKNGLDIVHVHFGIPYAVSAYLAQSISKKEGRSLPYIVTGHGTDIHTYGTHPDLNPMVRLAFENADAITYVGAGLKEIAERDLLKGGLGIKKEGIVIPNFVETNVFFPRKTSLRKKLSIPNSAFVLGHVSNFAPIKQTQYFSRLAQELANTGDLKNVYFLMCGAGDLKEKLERDVAVKGLSKHFRFMGKLESNQLKHAYSAMDFSALVSKREGCPLAILESWACGTPVIGTNVEGISHTISEGVNGFLFEQEARSKDPCSDDITKRDVLEFASVVKRAINNPSLRSFMGANSLDCALRNHSVDVVVNSYVDLYRRVIFGVGH
jgi:N-acetyl-alpha-D-glucosaminyl L-malate synthase BshA